MVDEGNLEREALRTHDEPSRVSRLVPAPTSAKRAPRQTRELGIGNIRGVATSFFNIKCFFLKEKSNLIVDNWYGLL